MTNEEVLLSLLGAASGRDGKMSPEGTAYPSGRTFWSGCSVTFAKHPALVADRAGLWAEGSEVRLGMWPGEMQSQYNRLYSHHQNVAELIESAIQRNWKLRPNFHIAYHNAQPTQRWYPTQTLDAPEYLHQWVDDLAFGRARGRSRSQLEDGDFRHWLVGRKYAPDKEISTLDTWLDARSPNLKFHVRPGLEIVRAWPANVALAIDERQEFVADVRATINQILTALDQPTLDEQPLIDATSKPKKTKAITASTQPLPPRPVTCPKCFTVHAGEECY